MEKTTLVLASVVLGVCAAGTACAAWNPGEPVTTYWAGPGFPGNERLSDRWLVQLKEGGFNTVWATRPEELDLAARYGFRVIYALDPESELMRLIAAANALTGAGEGRRRRWRRWSTA